MVNTISKERQERGAPLRIPQDAPFASLEGCSSDGADGAAGSSGSCQISSRQPRASPAAAASALAYAARGCSGPRAARPRAARKSCAQSAASFAAHHSARLHPDVAAASRALACARICESTGERSSGDDVRAGGDMVLSRKLSHESSISEQTDCGDK